MDNRIGFALKKITTEQFAIIEKNFESESDIRLNIKLNFAADRDQKIIGAFSLFVFEIKGNPFLLIKGGCHFLIAPMLWKKMIDEKNNRLIVPCKLLQHLSVLTIGTCRGILHAKTENTCFNKYNIPTINVTKLINEDKIIEFK